MDPFAGSAGSSALRVNTDESRRRGQDGAQDVDPGDYIAFAAPGVDLWTAAPGKNGVYVSGTSYAAPFVTAALTVTRQTDAKADWPALLKTLQAAAKDLGDKGKDAVFGWGLVQIRGCGAAAKRE